MTKRILLPIISGVALVTAFPPFKLGFLAWAGLIPLMFALDGAGKRKGFAAGYVYGFVFFLGTVYWVIHSMYFYGGVPLGVSIFVMLLLVSFLSLFTAFFGLFFAVCEGASPILKIMLIPSVWVGLEYIRGYLFTGFPWVLLGYTQARYLPLIQIADITGVWGVSFLIVAVNAGVFLFVSSVLKREKRQVAALIVSLGLLASTAAYGVMRISQVDAELPFWREIKAGVVQGSIDQSVKWDASYQQKTLDIYRAISVNAARAGARLIVWPETAIPFYFDADKIRNGTVGEITRETGSYLLTGSPSYTYNPDTREISYFNSAYLLSPDSSVAGKYDKIHLVPFGEYVPLRSILPFKKLTAGIGDFSVGPGPIPIRFEGGGIGVLICYESIFPDISRGFVKNGATLLVNITNDGWFGRTAAPYQHFDMSVFRAVENKSFLLRAANTGISAIIDPVGRIRKRTKLFEKAALVDKIGLRGGALTFYSEHGDVFSYGCFIISGIFILTRLTIRRRGNV